MELNNKDKIIIECLMQNCRMPVKEIAKKAHLTHPAVLYRIKKLEENRFISKYDALINLNKSDYPFSIILLNVPNKKKIAFENYCKKNENLMSLAKHIQKFNYSVSALLSEKEKKDLINYFEKNKFEYSDFTSEKIAFGNFSLFEDMEINDLDKMPKGKKLKLDKNDERLIQILSDGGGRKSILELARKLKLTADLVLYRFRKLKKHGYFAQFIAHPNLDKFHLRHEIIEIKVKNTKFDECFKMINKTKRLSFFSHDGKQTFFFTLIVKNLEDLEKSLEKIRTELDEDLIEMNIYPVQEWIFLNRLDLKRF